MKALFFFFLFSLSSSVVPEISYSNIEKVEVYFVDWVWQRRSPMKKESVKNNRDMKVILYSDESIANFIGWLDLGNLTKISDMSNFSLQQYGSGDQLQMYIEESGGLASMIDVRLVVEIYLKGEDGIIFLSDGEWLFDENFKMARKVDEMFRGKFRF